MKKVHDLESSRSSRSSTVATVIEIRPDDESDTSLKPAPRAANTLRATMEYAEAKAEAVRIKHQKEEVRAKESKSMRRYQAVKKGRVAALRGELARAKVEEKQLAEEAKRRALELKLAVRMEQVTEKEEAKMQRLRKSQQREKDARTRIHQMYPLLIEAAQSGNYSKVYRRLGEYKPHSSSGASRRPSSAPSLRAPLVEQLTSR